MKEGGTRAGGEGEEEVSSVGEGGLSLGRARLMAQGPSTAPYSTVLPRVNITWVYFQGRRIMLFINIRRVGW